MAAPGPALGSVAGGTSHVPEDSASNGAPFKLVMHKAPDVAPQVKPTMEWPMDGAVSNCRDSSIRRSLPPTPSEGGQCLATVLRPAWAHQEHSQNIEDNKMDEVKSSREEQVIGDGHVYNFI